MGLIGWWKLDGNAQDSVGDNDGSVIGSVSFVSGKINECFSTGSSAGRVATTIPDSFFKRSFSFSAWVKVKQWGLSQGVFGTRNSPNGWMLYRNAGDSNGLLRFYHHYTNTLDTETTTAHTYSGFPLNEWFHVVVIRTQGNYKTYFNGELVGDTNPSNFKHWNTNGTDFMLGAGGSSWQTSQMDIDDVRVYNHVLSKKEIKELSKAKMAHWKLDDEETITDSSSYNNIGTNNNASFTSESKIGSGAYEFDGSDYIEHNPIEFSSAEPWTFSSWIKANEATDQSWVFYAGDDTTSKGFVIRYSSNNRFSFRQTGGSYVTWSSNSFIPYLNKWTLVTWVADGQGNLELYVNGNKFEDTKQGADTTMVFSHIGRGYSSGGHWFQGYMNDVRIYATALSEKDVNELYKQRGSIDNQGNLHLTHINETGHKPLIMDYTIWEDGQTGSVGPFGQHSSRNWRTMGNDPWGKETVLWEGESLDGSTAGSGIYFSTSNPVDNTKLYRVSFWEKRVTNSTATYCRYYFGCNGYGSTNGVYRRDTGSLSTNPYFYNTSNLPTSAQLPEGEWVLFVGHIWPAGSGTGSDHPDSGRYTLNGKLGNISRDYVWHETTTTGRSRTLMIYRPDAGGVIHQSSYPRMDVIDGTEPSIQALISGFDSNNIEYIRQKGGASNVSLDIGSKQANLGSISEVGPANGLIGWWLLNGNTNDYSEEENDGSNNGASVVPGLNALAYEFSSTDQSIEVSNPLSAGEPHTLSIWVKPSSVLSTGGSSVRRTPFTGSGPIWSPGLWLTGSNIRVHAATEYRDYTINYNTTDWWHIGQIFDGTTCYTILNGAVLLGSRTGYSPSNPLTFRIGNEDTSSSYSWQGLIQDVRVYNRALSDEEIKILYDLTRPNGPRMKKTRDGVYVKGGFDETI